MSSLWLTVIFGIPLTIIVGRRTAKDPVWWVLGVAMLVASFVIFYGEISDSTRRGLNGSLMVLLALIIGNSLVSTKRGQSLMKALKNWNKVNEVIDGFAASMKDVPFETV